MIFLLIFNKLKKREIKSYEIPFMTHQEQNPKIWTKIIEEKNNKDRARYLTRHGPLAWRICVLFVF